MRRVIALLVGLACALPAWPAFACRALVVGGFTSQPSRDGRFVTVYWWETGRIALEPAGLGTQWDGTVPAPLWSTTLPGAEIDDIDSTYLVPDPHTIVVVRTNHVVRDIKDPAIVVLRSGRRPLIIPARRFVRRLDPAVIRLSIAPRQYWYSEIGDVVGDEVEVVTSAGVRVRANFRTGRVRRVTG